MATARNVQGISDTNEVSVQFTVHDEILANYFAEVEASGQADVAEQDEGPATDVAAVPRRELSRHEHFWECLDSLPKTGRLRPCLLDPVVSRRLAEGVR